MLRALIVDDEPPARRRLRKLLSPMEEDKRLHIVDEASDGFAALQILDEHEVDVLFLDIQMPEMDGFELIEQMPSTQRPTVVFVTAYDEYALRAFEANAVDYLLKPIARDRLEEAVSRTERLRASSTTSDERLEKLIEWMDGRRDGSAAANEDGYLDKITIPYRDRILVVPVSDLVAAEIEDGTTLLYVLRRTDRLPQRHLQSFSVSHTLDELEAKLDPDRFMRVHRSSIVHLDHVREMISWFSGRYKLILTEDHEVVASRQRSRKLRDRLMI